jgi:HSP20 family molecular chaperone IbpA
MRQALLKKREMFAGGENRYFRKNALHRTDLHEFRQRTSIEMTEPTGNKDRNAFDPLIRMTDDDRHIHVSIDLPGITEEQIRIDLEKTTFTVTISGDDNMLRKTIRVPRGVRIFKKKFSDGVLDILLEKPVP